MQVIQGTNAEKYKHIQAVNRNNYKKCKLIPLFKSNSSGITRFDNKTVNLLM